MSVKEGASSLRMQLARNSVPLGGRTLNGKLLKAMVALLMNSILSSLCRCFHKRRAKCSSRTILSVSYLTLI